MSRDESTLLLPVVLVVLLAVKAPAEAELGKGGADQECVGYGGQGGGQRAPAPAHAALRRAPVVDVGLKAGL